MNVIKIIFSIMITLPMLIFGRFLIELFVKQLGGNSNKKKRGKGRWVKPQKKAIL